MKTHQKNYPLSQELFEAVKIIKDNCLDGYCVSCPFLIENLIKCEPATKCALATAPFDWNLEVMVNTKI